jgi:hypothetical protein
MSYGGSGRWGSGAWGVGHAPPSVHAAWVGGASLGTRAQKAGVAGVASERKGLGLWA